MPSTRFLGKTGRGSIEYCGVLGKEPIYVIGFFFPVVPKAQSRIRVQISDAHTGEQIDKAIGAFEKVGKRHQVI